MLKSFVLINLFLRFFRADLQFNNNGASCSTENRGESIVNAEARMRQLSQIVAPTKDVRAYLAKKLENYVRLVLVRDPSEEKIFLRVVVEWGTSDGGRLAKQLRELLLDKFTKTRPGALSRRCCISAKIHPCYTQVDLKTDKSHFKNDVNCFLSRFNIATPTWRRVESGITVNSILKKISDGEELSLGEFKVFFEKIFLGSKTTFMVYGDITEEELSIVHSGASKIRSGPERDSSLEEIEIRKAYLIKDFEDYLSATNSPPGCYMMIILPCQNSFTQGNLLKAAMKILVDKVRENLLKDIVADLDYKNAEANFCITRLQSFVSVKLMITIQNATFEDHEEVLEGLFSYLKSINIFEDEYRSFVELMREEFEYKISTYSNRQILDHLSIGSFRWPAENYLNFSHDFSGIGCDKINEVLQRLLSDIDKWNIVVSSCNRSRLSKSSIFRIKSRLKQGPENPRIRQRIVEELKESSTPNDPQQHQ